MNVRNAAVPIVLWWCFMGCAPDEGVDPNPPPSPTIPAPSEPPAFLMTQHVTDPSECKTVCVPPGNDGELPDWYPDEAKRVACEGDYCARAEHGHTPGEEDEKCKAHYSCTVHCSEICCICLAECL